MTDPKDDPALASARTIKTDPGPLDKTVPASSASGPGGLLGRRYQVLAELGRGGEGAVFKVRDRHADEIVALKVLDNVREDSEELSRLRRELANARRITHPGIVRLHDLVEIDERWALSMQLIQGASLEARITKGPLYGAGELVELTRRLAEALAAAHAAGVTHRDLKPANVLLHPDGRPVISDFGISRAHKARERRTSVSGERGPLMQTQAGTIVGTPLYMAPEQLLGEPATPAVDVYALGLIVHEAATGTVPLVADTVPELLQVRTRGEAPSLGPLRPDLPTRFVATIDRCLARDPASRFRDGAELLEALLAAASTREPPPASAAPAPPKRRLLAAWIIGAITVTVPLSVIVTRALSARSAVGPASASASVGPSLPSVVAPSAPSLQLSPRGHRRITFSPGCEEFPTFLPDGKRVVFDGSVGEKSHLYVLDVETGAQEQLTTSPGWDFAAAASPVADEVAFLRYDLERRASYRLDLATKEVTLVAEGQARPVYTPDGSQIWAGDRIKPSRINRATGTVVETLSIPDGQRSWVLLPLRDGGLVVSFPSNVEGGQGGISAARGDGTDRTWRELTRENVEEVLVLAPGGEHLVTGRVLPTTTELVAIPLQGGPMQTLATASISPGKGLAFSPDGRRVVWSSCRDQNTFELADTEGSPTPSGSQGDFDGAALPNGKLVVLSIRDGTPRPWVIDPAGHAPPRQVPFAAKPVQVEAAPDGRTLVIATSTGLVLTSVDGAETRALTSRPGDREPVFRGEGEVVFSRDGENGTELMVIAVGGGEPVPLGVQGAHPAPVPGSSDVVYVVTSGGSSELMRWSGTTRAAHPLSTSLPPGRYHRPSVSRDGRLLAVPRNGVEVIIVDLATGRVVRVLKKGGDQLERPFFDASGRLYVGRARWDGDLWMADLEG